MAYEVVDTPEMIQMCLHCTRVRCVDCLAQARKGQAAPPVDMTTFKWDPPKLSKKDLIPFGKFGHTLYSLYCKGYTDTEIAEKLDYTQQHVSKIRRKMGLPRISRSYRDALHHMRAEGKL